MTYYSQLQNHLLKMKSVLLFFILITNVSMNACAVKVSPVIYFESGSTTLDAMSLKRFSYFDNEVHSNTKLEIYGHCDAPRECDEGDTSLSYQRAIVVRNKLIELFPRLCNVKVRALGGVWIDPRYNDFRESRSVSFSFEDFPIINEGFLYYRDSSSTNLDYDALQMLIDSTGKQIVGEYKKVIILFYSNRYVSLDGKVSGLGYRSYRQYIMRDPYPEPMYTEAYEDSVYAEDKKLLETAFDVEANRLNNFQRMIIVPDEHFNKLDYTSIACGDFNGIKYEIYETDCLIEE